MQNLYTTKQPREVSKQADHLSDVPASHENSLNTPKLKAKVAEIQFYLEMGSAPSPKLLKSIPSRLSRSECNLFIKRI